MSNPLRFLIFSTTDWNAPQFGSRQQIAQELARRGHEVLFIEVPRAIHSFISAPRATLNSLRHIERIRPIQPRLWAYTPMPVLPIYYHPLINAANQRLLQQSVQRALRKLGWDRPHILWTYWPNSSYQVGRYREQLSIYHCIDDFTAIRYPLTPVNSIRQMENELCSRVDLVLTRTQELGEAKRLCNPQTHILPGGVDTALFNLEQITAPDPRLHRIPHPRVGFFGTLDNRVDVTLLLGCAVQFPAVQFILVGPVKSHLIDLKPLQSLANVTFLPAQPHEQAPAIIAGFDVCLIPYRVNSYTQGLSPLKLYEYLAMGKPVIATNLSYLQREAELIHIANTPAEFFAGIESALETPPSKDAIRRRCAAANHHSWQTQVNQIETLLTPRLQPAP